MPRSALPYARAWNIALRTSHIGTSGILLGGHVLDVPRERLVVWLLLTIASGVCLTAIEAYPHGRWFHEVRGILVWGKLILLGLAAWQWSYRVPILAVVVVMASVGSHLPRRFRHYSPVYRCAAND